MELSVIAAVSENNVIGRDGALPWHLAADLRRFRRLTMGHCLIMGRKTWESIGRPLPGRHSIVLSSNPRWHAAGATRADDLHTAVRLASELTPACREAFVIGGAAIYRLALPFAHRIFLTRVHAEVAGDCAFPTVDWSQWRPEQDPVYQSADGANDHPSTFHVWRRTSVAPLPRASETVAATP